ncbi:hypothetical protein BH11PAT4_BH11PAT4_6180 [soil metagenome]
MVITGMTLRIVGNEDKGFGGVASGFPLMLEAFMKAAAKNSTAAMVFSLEDGNQVGITYDLYETGNSFKAFAFKPITTYHPRSAEFGKWDEAMSARFGSADVVWGIIRFLQQEKKRIAFRLNGASGKAELKFQMDGDIINVWTNPL